MSEHMSAAHRIEMLWRSRTGTCEECVAHATAAGGCSIGVVGGIMISTIGGECYEPTWNQGGGKAGDGERKGATQ